MAKYTFKHRCGHEERHVLIGPHKDRERRMAWLEATDCTACEEAALRQQRQEEAAAAAAAAQEMGLPALKGSEKQVAWAASIRQKTLNALLGALSGTLPDARNGDINVGWMLRREDRQLLSTSENRPRAEAWAATVNAAPPEERAALLGPLRDLAVSWVASKTAAHWWIDNRHRLVTDGGALYGVQPLAEEWGAEAARLILALSQGENPAQITLLAAAAQQVEAATEAEVRAECALYAEGATSPLLAEVRVAGGDVTLAYPEKNEDLRAVARDLGFFWDGAVWRHKTPYRPQDLAAEAAHRLLAAKIHVTVPDPDIRKRALAGDYAPFSTRYVSAIKADDPKHPGWLAIRWDRDRDGDWYRAATNLPGARWYKPFVVVPPAAFEEVEDFAAAGAFEVRPAARRILDAQKAARAAALPPISIEAAAVAPSGPPAPGDTPGALPVPAEVAVPDSLRDEDAE